MTTRILLILAMCSCGGSGDKGSDFAPSSPSTDDGQFELDVALRVNFIPSEQQRSNDVDAPYVALNQTVFARGIRDPSGVTDLGVVQILDPVVQSGTITAYQFNPAVAVLPGEFVPVEASVRLRLPDTVQTYAARSDGLGDFSMWAVPGSSYRLEIVPDDPLLPMYTKWLAVTDPAADELVELKEGVPIYGRVSSAGVAGLANARIHVVDEFGAVSATALSDELGLYQIRVKSPGTWTVVCEGRSNGKDPTLTFAERDVGTTGLNLDIAYPTDLTPGSVSGPVENLDGQPLVNATVRLTAESLDGYPEGEDAPWSDVSWTTDVFVAKTGFFGPVVPGVYTIEFLPPDGDGDDLSPLQLTGMPLGLGQTDLDPVELGPLVAVSGSVTGPGGVRLESAHVTCSEIGFDGRTTDVYTGQQGNFTIDLPSVKVSCEAEPPGAYADLAIRRVVIDPSESQDLDFELTPGHLIRGRVVSNTDSRVTVQVRDELDRVLGVGLTDADGVFSVPVDLEGAGEEE